MTGAEGAAKSSSGDVQVDHIVSILDELDDLPVAQHAAVYLDLHDRLSRELTPEQAARGAGAHGAS